MDLISFFPVLGLLFAGIWGYLLVEKKAWSLLGLHLMITLSLPLLVFAVLQRSYGMPSEGGQSGGMLVLSIAFGLSGLVVTTPLFALLSWTAIKRSQEISDHKKVVREDEKGNEEDDECWDEDDECWDEDDEEDEDWDEDDDEDWDDDDEDWDDDDEDWDDDRK